MFHQQLAQFALGLGKRSPTSVAASETAPVPALSTPASSFAPRQNPSTAVASLAEGNEPAASNADSTTAARLYELEWLPALFGRWARSAIELVRPGIGDSVLDVACGTGVVARAATVDVGITGRVVGLDANRDMLRVAQQNGTDRDDLSAAAIEWSEGTACAMPFPDAAFHIAYCQFGLQFFADQAAALCEIRRVLTPGGRAAFVVWGAIEKSAGFAILARALERDVGAAEAQMVRMAYVSNPQALVASLGEAGFCDIVLERRSQTARFRSVDHFLNLCLEGSRLGKAVASRDKVVGRLLLDRLRAGLARYLGPDGLTFPVEALVLRARR